MVEANVNPETSEILCPTCGKGDFEIFRRDRVSGEARLDHCKCGSCGQLFVYRVIEANSVILEKNKK